MFCPTQEDELRAKEVQAEETRFLSTFQSTPKRNSERLAELANAIVSNFNCIMSESRQKPFERQEGNGLHEKSVSGVDERD